jgi:DNA modification methylase
LLPEINTVYEGDCREVLAAFPDGCIDAVVCDPPYGLSDPNRRQSPFEVMANIVLPEYGDLYSGISGGGELAIPCGSVAHLDWVSRTIGKESRVGVPERTVNFDGYAAGGNVEVEHTNVLTGCIAKRVLTNKLNSAGGKGGCDFILNLRPARNAALCNSLACSVRQLGAGRIALPVVISAASSFHRYLSGCELGNAPLLSDVVGALDNALSNAKCPRPVHAGGATEVRAVLTLDMGNGTAEIIPAHSTDHDFAAFELCSPEAITTDAGASSLPSVFQPFSIGLIGDIADRAFTLHLHKSLLNSINYTGKGFMGKEWDGDVPSVEVWREVYRVLKDGGRLLAFSGTRTMHRMACNIEDAGFTIEDTIAWMYGSGFPKHGSKLKPAFEPVTVARKGRVSLLNIDACRIGLEDGTTKDKGNPNRLSKKGATGFSCATEYDPTEGRWPANVCLDSEAAAELDRQSGVSKSTGGSGEASRASARPHFELPRTVDMVKGETWGNMGGLGDSGGASRFFYCAKADSTERNAGLDDFEIRRADDRVGAALGMMEERGGAIAPARNAHPTVKPVSLMRWLVRLVAKPGELVLDPFCGSGTTLCACAVEQCAWIGIEREPEYAEIARARAAYWAAHPPELAAKGVSKDQGSLLDLFGEPERERERERERGIGASQVDGVVVRTPTATADLGRAA